MWSMQPDKASHWPGIGFTVVLPGNNVLKQLTAGNSGGQTEWKKENVGGKINDLQNHRCLFHLWERKKSKMLDSIAQWPISPRRDFCQNSWVKSMMLCLSVPKWWNHYNNTFQEIWSYGVRTLFIQLQGVSVSFSEVMTQFQSAFPSSWATLTWISVTQSRCSNNNKALRSTQLDLNLNPQVL